MHIDVRIDGDEAVLTLSGQLTESESPKLLREKVHALLREGCRNFVVDLKSISFVDSSGLSELVNLYSSVRRDGAVLHLRLNDRLADLLRLTKLLTIFEGDPQEHIPDPLNPRPREIRWQFMVGVAVTILVIIGVMLLLK